MKYYLSWGGGVNSTSLIACHILKLLKIPIDDLTIIFCDTGAETAETYKYINSVIPILKKLGYRIVILDPKNKPEFYRKHIQGYFLPEFLFLKKWILYPRVKVCQYEWKTIPIRYFMKKDSGAAGFYKRNCRHLLSIASDEQHRAIKKDKQFFKYPLIDLDIDRSKGQDLIKAAGLPQAHKTGCFFCPLQPQKSLFEVLRRHPLYLNQIEQLERSCNDTFTSIPKYFYNKMPIRKYYEYLYAKDALGWKIRKKLPLQPEPIIV